MILLIDNYDSFTYNLYQQIAKFKHDIQVVKNDKISTPDIVTLHPTHIIISAGPKRPQDSGMSIEIIKNYYKKIPILGVCLGHQCIGEAFGSSIVRAPKIVHGKTDTIYHTEKGLFQGVANPLVAARYNSLTISKVPNDFERTAWSEDGSIQAIQHTQYPLFGVQFHPESFMTERGEIIMENFLKCSA